MQGGSGLGVCKKNQACRCENCYQNLLLAAQKYQKEIMAHIIISCSPRSHHSTLYKYIDKKNLAILPRNFNKTRPFLMWRC